MTARPTTLVRRYIGVRGPGRRIAIVGLVDMLGAGLHLTILPLYLVTYAHVTAAQVGLVVGATGVAALFAPYLAGYLSDKVGPLLVWRISVALRMVGYALFAQVDSLVGYGLLALLLTPLDRAASNAQVSYLVSSFEPDKRNRAMAAVRSCRNAGLSLGLLAASAFIAVGTREIYRLAFVINAATFLVLLVTLATLPRPSLVPEPTAGAAARTDAAAEPAALPSARPWTDRRYLLLTLGDAMMSVHVTVLFVVFPLWMASQEHIPVALTGALLATNSVLTVLIQPHLARHGVGLRGASRLIRIGGAALVACGLLFWAASVVGSTPLAIGLVVLAMLTLTLGENVQEVATFEVSHLLAPPQAIGRYLGVFSMGDSAQRIAGPSVLTGAIAATPLGWGLVVLFTGVGSLSVLRAIGDEE